MSLPIGVRPNALAKWMRKSGVEPEEISAELGVCLQTVYKWRRGTGLPGRRHAVAIEAFTKGAVPAGGWD